MPAIWPKYSKKHAKVESKHEPGTFWHTVELQAAVLGGPIHAAQRTFTAQATMKDEDTATAVARRKLHKQITAYLKTRPQ